MYAKCMCMYNKIESFSGVVSRHSVEANGSVLPRSRVPVAKGIPRESGNRGKHVHGGEVLKSREHHRPLEVVIRRNVVGSVDGGNRVVSTLRRMVVGAVWGDVVPLSSRRVEALDLITCALQLLVVSGCLHLLQLRWVRLMPSG